PRRRDEPVRAAAVEVGRRGAAGCRAAGAGREGVGPPLLAGDPPRDLRRGGSDGLRGGRRRGGEGTRRRARPRRRLRAGRRGAVGVRAVPRAPGSADDDARPRARGGEPDPRAAQPDLALVRPVEAGEDVHQRRLARAVLAEQRVHLAGGGLEVDALVGDDAREALRDPVHRDCGGLRSRGAADDARSLRDRAHPPGPDPGIRPRRRHRGGRRGAMGRNRQNPAVPELARRLSVARGDEPADLVVRGGRVLSVFTREWLEADVAICDGHVAGLGSYEGREELDASGRFVVPGFVDAHMHLESTKLLLDEFARLVLPLGTTTVVADPHEIANVLGTDGVHWLLDACDGVPLDVYFTASSCVPASAFESPRRPLTTGDLEGLLRRRRVVGLAEMMNFPGVVAGDPAELAKLALAEHVDGHAPGLLGRELNAYAAAGIRSDHECSTIEEGRERLRAGMWVLIREASAAR